MISIEVSQEEAKLKFMFDELYFEDAMKFAGNCIETGDDGTKVTITITAKEEK